MEPIGIYGKRLVCIGRDGRMYVKRNNLGWFGRWLYRTFLNSITRKMAFSWRLIG